MYEVKVRDLTWKRHINQMRKSVLPRYEVSDQTLDESVTGLTDGSTLTSDDHVTTTDTTPTNGAADEPGEVKQPEEVRTQLSPEFRTPPSAVVRRSSRIPKPIQRYSPSEYK